MQLDERRIAVVATRSDAFVDEVANVTTGGPGDEGQALVRLYSHGYCCPQALSFLTDLNSVLAAPGVSGVPANSLDNLGVPPEAIAEIERTRKVPPR